MKDKNFVVFEYKTKTVPLKDRARSVDEAEAFGWEATETTPSIGGSCVVTFRRERKIAHRAELVKLEKRAEEVRATLENLEKGKTRLAKIFCWTFGIISTLVMGGGISLIMTGENTVKNMAIGIALGIAGIVLCLVNYPVYNKIALRKTRELTPAIDSGEEALANLLEQGNDLLSAKEI